MGRKQSKRIRLSFIGGRRPSILPPRVDDDNTNKEERVKPNVKDDDISKEERVKSKVKDDHISKEERVKPKVKDDNITVVTSSIVRQTNEQEYVSKNVSKSLKRKHKRFKAKPEHLHIDVLRKEVEESLETDKADNVVLMKEHKATLLAIKSDHVTWKNELSGFIKDFNKIDNCEVPILSADVQKSLDDLNEVCEKIGVAEIQSKLLKKTHMLMKEKAKKQLWEHQKEVNTTIYKDMDNTTTCATPRQLIRQILRPLEN